MSEADIRAAFAPFIGALVPEAQQPTGETRAAGKEWSADDLATLQALGVDPEAARPRAERVRLYGTYQIPTDTILLSVALKPEGGRNVTTVSVKDFAATFGSVFASGKKPTVAAFKAVCDAPVTVPKPTASDPNATEQVAACRGFCRIAREQDWVGKGIIAK